MILNISGRTDIVAFYTPWLRKRYQEGYVEKIIISFIEMKKNVEKNEVNPF